MVYLSSMAKTNRSVPSRGSGNYSNARVYGSQGVRWLFVLYMRFDYIIEEKWILAVTL